MDKKDKADGAMKTISAPTVKNENIIVRDEQRRQRKQYKMELNRKKNSGACAIRWNEMSKGEERHGHKHTKPPHKSLFNRYN